MLVSLLPRKKFARPSSATVPNWTRGALRSLVAIADFIALDNPARAQSFVAELRDRVEQLDRQPFLGRVGRLPGTRELVLHQHYIAIYRVRGEQVDILRIHHTAWRIG